MSFLSTLVLISAMVILLSTLSVLIYIMYDTSLSSEDRLSKVISKINKLSGQQLISLRGIDQEGIFYLQKLLHQKKITYEIKDKFYEIIIGSHEFVYKKTILELNIPTVSGPKILKFKRK